MFETMAPRRMFPNATYAISCLWAFSGILVPAIAISAALAGSWIRSISPPPPVPCPPNTECFRLEGLWGANPVWMEGLGDAVFFGTPIAAVIALVSARRWRSRGVSPRQILLPWGVLAASGMVGWLTIVAVTFTVN